MGDRVKRQCEQCGYEWRGTPGSTCYHCRMADLFAQLPPDLIAKGDKLIYSSMALNAIRTYKDATGMDLRDAKSLYDWRAAYLRKHFPERFENAG